MPKNIIPAGPVISDLQKQASEYEQQAARAPARIADQLHEKAALCREWIKLVSTGSWSS